MYEFDSSTGCNRQSTVQKHTENCYGRRIGSVSPTKRRRNFDDGGIEDSPIDGVISAVGLRRILLTKSVGVAWEKFGQQKQRASIKKTFRRLESPIFKRKSNKY